MDYEQDIEIDEAMLDVMWLDQPRLMARYCRLAAHAHQVLGLAEERLNYVKSTLARDIRADPAAFDVVPGSRGITEDQIKAATRVQETYRAASRAHITAQYENDVAVGAVRAFDQRKSALENLVRLHGQQYFAGPAVPHDLSAERQRRDQDKRAQRSVRLPSGRGDSVSERPPKLSAETLGPGISQQVDAAEQEPPRPRFQRRTQ